MLLYSSNQKQSEYMFDIFLLEKYVCWIFIFPLQTQVSI